MITIKENELYQEISIEADGVKIGEAEVDVKGKMLSRLMIYEPYRHRGYGMETVRKLCEMYGVDKLWVNADNYAAIKTYERCGFDKIEPTMWLMERDPE